MGYRGLSFAILLSLGLMAGSTNSASAADPVGRACLSIAEERASVESHQTISSTKVVRVLREHGLRAELVRAQLCRRGGGFITY
jgi:hypothetical protein